MFGCWPQSLRRVRSLLPPWKWLNTCWHAWHDKPPLPELVEPLAADTAGLGIDLHLRESGLAIAEDAYGAPPAIVRVAHHPCELLACQRCPPSNLVLTL